MESGEDNRKENDPNKEAGNQSEVQRLVVPDDEQMCCYICFHIAEKDTLYETHHGDGEEFPICPKCGNWNTGGYSSYARAEIIMEDDLKHIVSGDEA
jgi:hypothetical protein